MSRVALWRTNATERRNRMGKLDAAAQDVTAVMVDLAVLNVANGPEGLSDWDAIAWRRQEEQESQRPHTRLRNRSSARQPAILSITAPPFITTDTFRMLWMSLSGSASRTTRSASLPGSIVPNV